MKMWSHYADDCRGVVVGYNVDNWVRHLAGTSVIRKVTYADKPPLVIGPRVLNQENAYAFMSCKGASWEDEREWRLITELTKTQQAREGIAVITVPQQSVSSVMITDRTPEDVVDRIVGRLNDSSNGYRVSRINKMQRGARCSDAGVHRTDGCTCSTQQESMMSEFVGVRIATRRAWSCGSQGHRPGRPRSPRPSVRGQDSRAAARGRGVRRRWDSKAAATRSRGRG